jgi:hypothetical protein
MLGDLPGDWQGGEPEFPRIHRGDLWSLNLCVHYAWGVPGFD